MCKMNNLLYILDIPQVFNLRRLGRRLWRALGQYHTLPPVVEKIKALIRRVTALFNDIKTDVMRFYNVRVFLILEHYLRLKLKSHLF